MFCCIHLREISQETLKIYLSLMSGLKSLIWYYTTASPRGQWVKCGCDMGGDWRFSGNKYVYFQFSPYCVIETVLVVEFVMLRNHPWLSSGSVCRKGFSRYDNELILPGIEDIGWHHTQPVSIFSLMLPAFAPQSTMYFDALSPNSMVT